MAADLAVLGGGVAGHVAALSAAETAPDAEIVLVTDGADRLRRSNGLIDVLGYLPESEGPVEAPLDAIERLPDSHPYRTLGADRVTAALSWFDDVAGERYVGGHTGRNALFPTPAGTVAPAARYPVGAAGGVVGAGVDALLVGFDRLPALDASAVADALAARSLPATYHGLTVGFPADDPAEPVAETYATLLDEDAGVAGNAAAPGDVESELVPARDALVEAVRPYRDDEPRIGFPAILGDRNGPAVRDHLEDAFGATVFELPTGHPGLGGSRLEALLRDRLEEAGGRVEAGTIADATASDDRIQAVTVADDDGERSVEAADFVLATGGVAGGGIRADRSRVRERVFDCPVEAPSTRAEWSDRRLLGDHPFASFGVGVDDELRPMDGAREGVYDNLQAAGSVLGGFDPVREHSRAGVALATGYVAGRTAVGARD